MENFISCAMLNQWSHERRCKGSTNRQSKSKLNLKDLDIQKNLGKKDF